MLAHYKLKGLNPNIALLKSNIIYNSSNNTWELSDNFNDLRSILTIQKTSYSYRDFLIFLNKNNKLTNKNRTTKLTLNKQYKLFLEQSVFQYQKDNLENENQDFANILNEYREGLLLFELMQDKIWEGAKNDSVGIKAFYNLNKEYYLWPDRVVGSVVRSSNLKNVKKVRKLWIKGYTNQMIDELLNKTKQNVIFSNGEFALGESPLPQSFTITTWGESEIKSPISKVIEENNSFYVVNVNEFKPQSQKSLEEAKGQLISDYQTKLEAQWILELKSKFDVNVNQDIFQKVNSIISN